MPIYAYKCASCGFAKDVLQKISEAPLADCPACGEPAFGKQVTAAGFQLKGSGWYATDFKGEKKPASEKKDGSGKAEDAGDGKKPDGKGDAKNGGGEVKSDAKPASSDKTAGSSSGTPADKPSKPAAAPSGGS